VNLSLNVKDAQNFPPFPERIENLMSLESSLVLDMLSKVSFLIPQNNANPALNGLYLEISPSAMTMTTTDGHCLAQVGTTKHHLDESKKWLVPRRAIFEIKKLLENAKDETVFLGLCGNQLVFSGESFNFFTKLLADPFPQYESILQRDGFRAAVVDRSSLIKTLRRSSCLLSGQFIATSFGFTPDHLHVSMENKDVGMLAEQLPLSEFQGDELNVRFYAPYLLSGLQVFTDETVRFSLKNTDRPIVFEAQSDTVSILYLVMPVSPTAAR
jgi:DNA polymerase-3 subunit beta